MALPGCMALPARKGRSTIIAGLAVLAAGAGTSPSVLPDATAQTNSRLCGRYWTNSDTGETVIRLYEVNRGDWGPCQAATALRRASGKTRSQDDAPWKLEPSAHPDWRNNSLHFGVCEDFKKDYAQGRDWVYQGEGWPGETRQDDICLNMNRSDTLLEMETYWLYDDGSLTTWKFKRG